jgi:long-subunit fatty acid transport protein
MKKLLLLLILPFVASFIAYPGGIVTNTNQSAMYTRMGNRTATLGIDAVYYNPAGLTKLGKGFHFSINNQTIGQTRTVTSDYANLNEKEYLGKVSAPLFPGIYAVFNTGKLAFSLGFNPIGGGGGATYDKGLPSFEYTVSDLVPALTDFGVTAYSLDAFFEGSSTYMGYQGNVSYAINDMISIALGARLVTAKEVYSGHLKTIRIIASGNETTVPEFFTGLAAQATTAATNAALGASLIQASAISNPNGALNNSTVEAILSALDQDPSVMTNAVAYGTLNALNTGYTLAAAEATAKAQVTGILMADQDVDATKTGRGITPIISVNVQPTDMLNIAVKYELNTKIELTTKADADKQGIVGLNPLNGDPVYLFPDKGIDHLDMPAHLSVGAGLRPIKPLLVAGMFGYFFDKNADWDGRQDLLESNSWEAALAAEYNLSKKFLVSAGWSMTKTGATSAYQTDISYSLGTQGLSFGLAYDILPILQLNLGGQLVSYADGERTFQHDFASSGTMVTISEKLQKTVWLVGVGVNISLAGKAE